jgi:hypothetical protein
LSADAGKAGIGGWRRTPVKAPADSMILTSRTLSA